VNKATPVEKRGRKATGLHRYLNKTAGLPLENKGSPAFLCALLLQQMASYNLVDVPAGYCT
jgi:hypothetical protein